MALFMKRMLASIRPSSSSTFLCNEPKGLKLIAKLRLGLSHLRFHEFRHIFQDALNPICNCGTIGLPFCPNFSNERLNLLSKIWSNDEIILSKNDSNVSKMLLFGDHSINDAVPGDCKFFVKMYNIF